MVIEVPTVSIGNAPLERYAVVPAKGMKARDIEQLAGGAIRLGQIMNYFDFCADGVANHLRGFENGVIDAGTDIEGARDLHSDA